MTIFCDVPWPTCPLPQALKQKRSCKLVPECISAKNEQVTLSGQDATARVTAAGGSGPKISCAPLEDLLARYAGSADQVVDLWILDVEGYEMQVLQGTNFSEVGHRGSGNSSRFLPSPTPPPLRSISLYPSALQYVVQADG